MNALKPLIQFAAKHWELISAVALCLISIGTAREQVGDLETRVGWIEDTQPEATSALVHQQASDIAAIRRDIDRVTAAEGQTAADLAWLKGYLTPKAYGPNSGAPGR
jgi:hypothetical protein